MKEISAGIVVFRQNRHREYLLLHYPEGHWDFPKGHIGAKETAKEAAARELKEETGIATFRLLNRFKEKISYFYKSGTKTIFKDVFFFLAETKQQQVKLSYEHQGFQWLDYDDALNQLTYSNAKGLLEKAEKFITKQFA